MPETIHAILDKDEAELVQLHTSLPMPTPGELLTATFDAPRPPSHVPLVGEKEVCIKRSFDQRTATRRCHSRDGSRERDRRKIHEKPAAPGSRERE
jgi:hypothetical protein